MQWTAEIPIIGEPAEARCRLIITVQDGSSWPAGSFSLLWRGVRVRGLDLDGAAHYDAVDGYRVPTPHRQWLDHLDRQRARSLDLTGEHIHNLEDVLNWFLRQTSIEWSLEWRPPPIQLQLKSQDIP